MKPTATEAKILRNENGLFQEMIGEQLESFFQEIRVAFESGDDAFLGSLVSCAISDYAEGVDDAERCAEQAEYEADAAHESRMIDRDNARAINAGRY